MAITVTASQVGASGISQLLYPLIVKGDSNQTAQPKFRYLVDFSVDGATRGQFKYPANNNDVCLVDVTRMIESYLTPCFANTNDYLIDLLPESTATNAIFSNTNGNIKVVTINVTELYAASATTTPTTHSTNFVDIAVILSRNVFTSPNGINIADFASTGTSSRFLSNSPSTQEIRLGDYATIGYFNCSTAGCTAIGMRISFYNAAGTLLNSGNTDLTFAANGTQTASPNNIVNQDKLLNFAGIGPANLERCNASSIKPSNYSTLAYYTVELYDGSSAVVSETKRFNIQEECPEGYYRLKFLNAYGTWDYFNFTGKYEKKTNVTSRESFTRIYGDYNAASYSYNQWERGETIVNIEADEEYKVTTTFRSEAEMTWLKELVTSREVFFMVGATIYPVIITSNEIIEGTTYWDRVLSLELTFKLANKPNL